MNSGFWLDSMKRPIKIFLVALLYCAIAKLSLLLAIPPGYATAIWPAAGLALAGVLRCGYGIWPGIWLGSFLANLGTSLDLTSGATVLKSLELSLGIGLGASIQAMTGAFFIRRFVKNPFSLQFEKDVIKFLILGGPLSCLISSVWGVENLFFFNQISPSQISSHWLTWWTGDTIGVLIFSPLALAWSHPPLEPHWQKRRLSISLPFLVTFIFIVIAFVQANQWENEKRELEFNLKTNLTYHETEDWDSLMGGLVLTLLLSAFILILTGRTSRIEDLVTERTRALKKANQDLQDHLIVYQKTEQALLEKTKELGRSNQDLEQFAYVASHDLQEPLRMVSGYVQLLAKRYKDKLGQDANEFIHFATDGAQRMHEMINDLLEYSRIGRSGKEKEIVDCEKLLEEILLNLKETLDPSKAGVSHDPLPQIQVEKLQMKQLLQNLIGNAIKYRSDQPPQIHISAKPEDRAWLFSVKDNGIGIDPQYHDRIFVIFQRLHSQSEYQGTGIGLAICKKIVESQGGKIWVESQVGQGSTFYFTIQK
ncbi:MAG: MASE1 domain-containing protein [Chlamydiae bacterium]|nr:MASE1 domain-containing protein [Chlamydiota bacterium]MBI3267368.1 MASE1 domain-containing protein [Chlamydiota bacterium]